MRQHASFVVQSDVRHPDEISELFQFEPDVSKAKGSSNKARQVPRTHLWEVKAEGTSAPVDAQIREIISRLGPIADRILRLVEDGTCKAVLRVSRHFNDPDGEEEHHDPIISGHGILRILSGQHQLLGWLVDREIIDFLVATGAVITVDEYG